MIFRYLFQKNMRNNDYVIIMSRTHFRVNLHSIFAWMSRNSLLETSAISEVKVTATRQSGKYECGFTLKCVRDMIITYSQMHRTDKYSQHSSIIWPVWPNGWVFVYELSGCGFESCEKYYFTFWPMTVWIINVDFFSEFEKRVPLWSNFSKYRSNCSQQSD